MTTYNIALGNKVPGGITVNTDDMFRDHGARLGTEWAADFATIAATSPALMYLIEYGIKQSLNDAIAAVKVTDEDYTVETTRAIVEKRWAAILSGNVRQAGTREASDPIGVEAKRIAAGWFKTLPDQSRKSALTAIMAKNGIDEKEAKAKIIDAYAAQDAVREQAKKVLAVRAPDVEIDLAGLGLGE
jgi:hypothetical protein